MLKYKPIFLSVLSGILLSLSFPNFNLTFLAWFGLVPLFLATKGCSLKKTFTLWYLGGVVFYLITIYWIIHVTLIGLVLLVLYLALYFGAFGILLKKIENLPKVSFLLVAPAIWVMLEYIRSYFLSGFGWALLGYSQTLNLPLIQIADITGAYGVSYLVLLVNVLAYLIIDEGLPKRMLEVVVVFFILAISFSYGIYRLNENKDYPKINPAPRAKTQGFLEKYPNITLHPRSKERGFTEGGVKIAVIQGNIPQDMKWDETRKEFILKRYEDLTREASWEKPDLIIWPETSAPGYFELETDIFERITNLVKDIKIPLIVGSIGYDFENGGKPFNSAILIKDNAEHFERHNKLHLVPFGEFVPFEKWLGFIRNFVYVGDFKSGRKYVLLNIDSARIGTLICFEDTFSDIVRNFVKTGANLMVNITNDAWFKNSSAPFQHAQASVFRAIENRVFVVRCANTGLSCFIDENGRVYGRVRDDAGKNIDVTGFSIKETGLLNSKTFYTRYGDLFVFVCMIVSVITIIITAPISPVQQKSKAA
jgi:apolipoprotein N-acyltransferase